MSTPTLVWFRQDLRIHDNPALTAALERGGAVIPVFAWAPQEHPWAAGRRTRAWLAASLRILAVELERVGLRLVIRQGRSRDVLADLVRATGAEAVAWNRRYEPWSRDRDARVRQALEADGIRVLEGNALLLREPWELATKAGEPFRVFTPFWKAHQALGAPPRPLPAHRAFPAPSRWPQSTPGVLEAIGGDETIASHWSPGEAAARDLLRYFLNRGLVGYGQDRDRPDLAATSMLSPHLHFGELSPRLAWWEIERHRPTQTDGWNRDADKFLAELGWREFGYHLLHHFPHTPDQPLNAHYAAFPWREDPAALAAWKAGRTGYPIVDAGMRQLAETGWMHNRVRMVTASFLVKDLLLPWQDGARHFWDQLVDADLASNTQGWQWTSGCGADAAPYFRIFNPVLQGEKFDPDGSYVRRWVPELATLPAAWIHKPWLAPPLLLAEAGVSLGDTYPRPIVDHREARERALSALAEIRLPDYAERLAKTARD